MIITNATLDTLRVTLEKRFDAAYQAAALTLEPLWTEVPSSTASNVYAWTAHSLGLREWIGPRVAQNLSEHSYTIRNKSYEGTVELDRDDIEDDNLGMFVSATIPGLAEAVRKFPEKLMVQMLQSNSANGPTAFDGLPLFDENHPCFDSAGTVYSNKRTLALNATNLALMIADASDIVGEDGEPLEVDYTHLIVPKQLEFTAKQILQSANYASLISGEGSAAVQIDNVMKGALDIIVSPKLNNDPTRFYLADLSKPIKPLIRQVRRAPEFVSRDDPKDPKVFDLRKYTYGVDLREGAGVSLPFLIATSKP